MKEWSDQTCAVRYDHAKGYRGMGCSFVLLSFRLTLASPCHIISSNKVPFIGLPFLRGVHNLLSLGGYLRTSFYLVYFICWKLHDLSSS